MNGTEFSASGKLLLFGEYLVLRGAKSLVMPLHYRQTLTISPYPSENILWKCFEKGIEWLEIEFSPELEFIKSTDEKKGIIVQSLLQLIQKERPSLKIAGLHFHFEIDFDRNFGFGTSSTFLSLLSQWSRVNPYLLMEKSFGGSGFDLAAATARGPLIYQTEGLSNDAKRKIETVKIPEEISKQLLFVYTGKKKKTRGEVSNFEKMKTSQHQINEMNNIIDKALANDIENFEVQMKRSELLLSTILGVSTIQSTYFSDYPFAVKSLGAWGGDFIMAAFRKEEDARNYFLEKGMNPIFNYQHLIRK